MFAHAAGHGRRGFLAQREVVQPGAVQALSIDEAPIGSVSRVASDVAVTVSATAIRVCILILSSWPTGSKGSDPVAEGGSYRRPIYVTPRKCRVADSYGSHKEPTTLRSPRSPGSGTSTLSPEPALASA